MQELPDFKAQFPKWERRDLRELVPHPERLNDAGLNLVAQMLTYAPNVRRGAAISNRVEGRRRGSARTAARAPPRTGAYRR